MRIYEFTEVIGGEVKIYRGVEGIIKMAAEGQQIAITHGIFVIFSGFWLMGKISKKPNFGLYASLFAIASTAANRCSDGL